MEKPKGAIAEFSLVDSIEKLALKTEVVAFCANQTEILTTENAFLFEDHKLLLDVGKGNISRGAQKFVPNAEWLDVSFQLVNEVRRLVAEDCADVRSSELALPDGVKLAGGIVAPLERIAYVLDERPYIFGELSQTGTFKRYSFEEIVRSW